MIDKVIYLSIPYSWNPNKSFEIANRVQAELIANGYVVLSPISNSHPCCEYLPEAAMLDHELWMRVDIELLRRCDEVVLVNIRSEEKSGTQLIKESRGCQKELKEARDLKLPVTYFEYYG